MVRACIGGVFLYYRIRDIFYRHFQNNFFLYLLVVTCLLIGISAGAITINVLNNSQKQQLISFLDAFFKILNEEGINSFLLLKQSFINNIQTAATIWILGVIVIGIPVIIGVIILRGFIIGFTVGFLFDEFGLKGLLFSLLAILPQNIFIIPGLVIITVISISFSLNIIKNKIKRNSRYSFVREFLVYSTTILIISSVLIIGSIIEAYITPVFMKLISGYIE